MISPTAAVRVSFINVLPITSCLDEQRQVAINSPKAITPVFLLYLSGNVESLEGASNKINKNKDVFQIGINQHVMQKLVGRQQNDKVLGTERGAWAWLYALGISKEPSKNMEKTFEKTTRKQTARIKMRRLKTTHDIAAGYVLVVSHDRPLAG